MLRAALAVIAGYLTIFVVVFAGLTLGYLALGADRAFRPDSYEVSLLWIKGWAVVSFAAAIVGGIVCAAIARTRTPVVVLVALVLVLGAGQAIGVAAAPKREPESLVRPPDATFADTLGAAHSPLWVAMVTPVLGAVGVIAGAGFAAPRTYPPADH